MSDLIEVWEFTPEESPITYEVRAFCDTDATPYEADCYDAEDIRRWMADEWRYVGLDVRPIVAGQRIDDAAVSLWGIEWGCNPGFSSPVIGRDQVNVSHVPDLCKDAYEKLTDVPGQLAELAELIRNVL